MSSLVPLRVLADLTNIGHAAGVVIVCSAVLVMRKTHPEAERPFRAPWCPGCDTGILFCLVLMFSLPSENWLRLFIWLAIGLAIYFLYGRKRSVLAKMRMNRSNQGSRV